MIVAWVVGGILIVAAIIGYFCYVFFMAGVEVQAAPREPMEWCSVHGPIRKDHMIQFLNTPVCPICFHKSLRDAEHNKL